MKEEKYPTDEDERYRKQLGRRKTEGNIRIFKRKKITVLIRNLFCLYENI